MGAAAADRSAEGIGASHRAQPEAPPRSRSRPREQAVHGDTAAPARPGTPAAKGTSEAGGAVTPEPSEAPQGAPTGWGCCPRARAPFPVRPASWPAGADTAERRLRGASHPCGAAHGAQPGLTAASRLRTRLSTRAPESVRPLPFLPHLHHGCQVPATNPDSGGGAKRAEQHGRCFFASLIPEIQPGQH